MKRSEVLVSVTEKLQQTSSKLHLITVVTFYHCFFLDFEMKIFIFPVNVYQFQLSVIVSFIINNQHEEPKRLLTHKPLKLTEEKNIQK